MGDKKKNGGRVSCIDAKSGKILWEHLFPRAPQNYYASPLIGGNHFYAARSDGTVFSGELTDSGIENVTECALRETTVASPVAVGNKLLIRTHEHLWCFE